MSTIAAKMWTLMQLTLASESLQATPFNVCKPPHCDSARNADLAKRNVLELAFDEVFFVHHVNGFAEMFFILRTSCLLNLYASFNLDSSHVLINFCLLNGELQAAIRVWILIQIPFQPDPVYQRFFFR